jgi:hypothetical protein
VGRQSHPSHVVSLQNGITGCYTDVAQIFSLTNGFDDLSGNGVRFEINEPAVFSIDDDLFDRRRSRRDDYTAGCHRFK